MKEVQIIGTGSYVPNNVVDNSDLEKLVDTSDEWITKRTGIKQRRITTKENTSYMATIAANEAIKNAGINAKDIDLIVVATATPDSFIPSTACVVQGNIGAENATCFDISAACSGFVYGVNIATQFIKTGECKTVLVIGAETLSRIIDWNDRGTCILFGDGAGAAVFRVSKEKGIMSLYSGSDGSKASNLVCNTEPIRNPYINNDYENYSTKMTMNGKEIFKFAVKVIEEGINKVIEKENLSLDDIKYVIPHQANSRIIEFVANKMKVDKSKFYTNLQSYGNTSGASVPLALDEINRKGLLKKGDKLVLVGFGGGLTFGSVLLSWTK